MDPRLVKNPGDAVEAAHIKGCELLERHRRQVDVARRAALASVRDSDGDGLAVGARDCHRAAAHRVSTGGGVSAKSRARDETWAGRRATHALGFAPAPGKEVIVAWSTATIISVSWWVCPQEVKPPAGL